LVVLWVVARVAGAFAAGALAEGDVLAGVATGAVAASTSANEVAPTAKPAAAAK
jgi:hypothetical protein